MKFKEICKFAAGVTAWEAVVHMSFAVNNQFPITLLGIEIDRTLNLVQIILPVLASVACIYYSWLRR